MPPILKFLFVLIIIILVCISLFFINPNSDVSFHKFRAKISPQLEKILERISNSENDVTGGAVLWGNPSEKKLYPLFTKKWEEYTWDQIYSDNKLFNTIYAEREKILEFLNIDWDPIRAQLAHELKQPNEFAGIIRFELRNDRLIPKITKSEESKDIGNDDVYAASVSGEIVERLQKTPGHCFYHTHPPNGMPCLSPADAIVCASQIFSNLFLHAVISVPMISLYGLEQKRIIEFYKKPNDERRAVFAQYLFDLFASLESVRSWRYWGVEDLANILRKFQFRHEVFPTDKYTPLSRELYKGFSWSDFETLEYQLSLLKEYESKYNKVYKKNKNQK